ncbi:MAG: pectin acetylesterase-family hydrolase, partial [Bauldia sp.]
MQRIFPVLMLAGVGLAGMGLGRGGDAFAQQPIGNGAASKPMIKVEVRDPKRPQAQCNDGSPPVFYFQPGSGPDRNKWVIYLEGGTACMSDASCKQRAVSKPYLVTGSKVPATMIAKGILSTQTSANPDFAHYNHVLAHYCSSDFWAGDTERRIGDATWQFRGR